MKKLKRIFETIKSNGEPRTFYLAGLAFFINIAFFAYNLVFGIAYRLIWNWSISIYYAILIFLRAMILLLERKWSATPQKAVNEKRLRLRKEMSLCMLVMDLSLIAPVTLMVLSRRQVRYGMIPTIAMAAYTTYKVTLAAIHFTKRKQKSNLSVQLLREITLKDAIVSVLTLQNAMLMQFSEGESFLALSACTSAGMLLLLVGITISSILTKPKTT